MRKTIHFSRFTRILASVILMLCGTAARAQWTPPPPEKRDPLDVVAVMIYAAHEDDRATLIDCVDTTGFYREYLARTDEPHPLTESEFRTGLLFALSNSSSDKLDEILKGLKGREKYKFIMMFVKSYSEVKDEGKDMQRIIVRATDEEGRQPEITLRRTSGIWRVVWVEPFDHLRELFGQAQGTSPASSEPGKQAQAVLDPSGADQNITPALDQAPAKRTPAQVLSVLLLGTDRKDWDLAMSAFDIKGMRDNLVRDMPALDFLSSEKLTDIFSKVLSRSSQKISSILPAELNRLNEKEKAEMVELMVRALSKTVVTGSTARVTIRHPDDTGKTYEYKMNKTADGWKIDVLSVFDNVLDKFMGQMNRK